MSLIHVNMRELKVLVVEGNGTLRQMLKRFLQEMWVETVELAEDGAEGIKKLQEFPADLVLCDLHMTPLDGIEFTRLLRSVDDSPNPYLPVLILTSDATAAQLRNALGAGANDFMVKPINIISLRRKIHGIFARPNVFLRDGRYLKPLRITQTGRSEDRLAPGALGAPGDTVAIAS